MIVEMFLARYMRFEARRRFSFKMMPRPPVLEPMPDKDYLLYVHIPFCESLCSFCTFYRVPFDRSLAGEYFRTLDCEIKMYRDMGIRFRAVYVGGGTPTVMPEELAGLLERIRGYWSLSEISVETHPRHLVPETIARLAGAGVTRLSVGVQTFDDSFIATLKREPLPSAEVRRRLELAKGNFDTVNVDMMYNFPSQSMSMVLRDIAILRDLEMDQVTFYPIMMSERNTVPKLPQPGREGLRRERRFYRRISSELADLYSPVSAWCFTRKEGMIDEYIVDFDEYAGIGAGSFGYINGLFYANFFDIAGYMARLRDGSLPIMAARQCRAGERIRYDFLMQLFGTSMSLEFMGRKYGKRVWFRLWKEIVFFLMAGAAVYRRKRLDLMPGKAHYLVILMKEFFSGINCYRELCMDQAAAPEVVVEEVE